MTYITDPPIRRNSLHDNGVVLITHADTDSGCQLARRLLAGGQRVVVTAANPRSLVRILHGHSASDVMAIAVDVDDTNQWTRLLQCVDTQMGPIAGVLDGREIHPSHALVTQPLG